VLSRDPTTQRGPPGADSSSSDDNKQDNNKKKDFRGWGDLPKKRKINSPDSLDDTMEENLIRGGSPVEDNQESSK
jgi:hypothetical protein